jgi:hypothetical protein
MAGETNLTTPHVLVPWGCLPNYNKVGILKQQKFILTVFWMPEIGNQDASSILLPPEATGKNHSCLLKLLVAVDIS